MAEIQLTGYRCERCGHEWVPRERPEDPKVCPRCKSPYWDRPRTQATPEVAPLVADSTVTLPGEG